MIDFRNSAKKQQMTATASVRFCAPEEFRPSPAPETPPDEPGRDFPPRLVNKAVATRPRSQSGAEKFRGEGCRTLPLGKVTGANRPPMNSAFRRLWSPIAIPCCCTAPAQFPDNRDGTTNKARPKVL